MLNNKTQSDSSDTKVAEDSAAVGGKQSFNSVLVVVKLKGQMLLILKMTKRRFRIPYLFSRDLT